MKKILSIALVAAFIATSVFAVSISGEASLGFDYKIDDKAFGFANNGTMNQVKFTFADEFFNESKEVKGEGDIYAGIKASLKLSWSKDMKVGEFTWNEPSASGWETKGSISQPGFDNWGFVAKIEEAYITNGVWKLNILGSKVDSDYAVSAIDYWKNADESKTYYVSGATASDLLSVNPGFIFTMDGYTASLGLTGDEHDTSFNAFAETKEFDLNGVKLQAALVAGRNAEYDLNSVGGSVKGNFESEKVNASVAADIEVVFNDDDSDFNMDAVAKAAAYGVTVDAYYAKNACNAYNLDENDVVIDEYKYAVENLLSAKVAYDTTIEDIKVGVAFTGLDLINSQDLAVSASASVDKISGTVYGGYIVKTKTWKAGASASYTEDLYKVEGAVDAEKDSLKVSAKVSSETLVAGATLEAGYASGNLLADSAEVGTISAKATIKF